MNTQIQTKNRTARLGAVALALALLIAVGSARADRLQLVSGPQQTTLLELFTSEGCSSCPPADRWLSELKTDPTLWKHVVPVAFHVDYWDYIGWRDRFAHRDYSDRQRRYAHEGGANTVYTPGMFQNGAEWRGWWRGRSPTIGSAPSGRLAVAVDGQRVNVDFDPQTSLVPDQLHVHVALLGMDLESRVTAGENDGRVLRHDFVVLGLESTPLKASADKRLFAAELSLPGAQQKASRHALAAWVAAQDRQTPLQAVGGYLSERSTPELRAAELD